MIQFILLFSKQAKPRLQKWFTSHTEKTKKKMFREVTTAVLSRSPVFNHDRVYHCNSLQFLEDPRCAPSLNTRVSSWSIKDTPACISVVGLVCTASQPDRIVMCVTAEEGDNELLTLEIIHHYVELLDQYFGSVCELDIIYNYEKVRRVSPSLSLSLLTSGLLHSRRISPSRGDPRQLQEEYPQCHQTSRFSPRGGNAAGFI